MTFRTDIHGLRGLSVLVVVLFHFGVPGFGGGYAGVDIFFVISGFLITNILLNMRSTTTNLGKQSVWADLKLFYIRRVKRILPAALAVLFFFGCITVSAFPTRTAQVGREILYAVPALSNFYYGNQSGYFALQAHEFVFLNYWSLAVEEQFYLLWPILLFCILGIWQRHIHLFILFGAFSLFFLACFMFARSPEYGFYWLPGRAWELAVGALMSVGTTKRLSISPVGLHVLRYVGALLIIGFLLFFMDVSPQALPFALLPLVFGAALIVGTGHCSNSNIVSKLLHFPPLQWLGSISYSLYLIHWPLLVLSTFALGRSLTSFEKILAISASVGLAILCWCFIEQPFRRGRIVSSKVFSTGLAYAVVVFALGSAMSNGILQHINPLNSSNHKISNYVDQRSDVPAFCHIEPNEKWAGAEACRLGVAGDGAAKFWLVGDSHARHWFPGINAFATRNNISGTHYSAMSSLPIFQAIQIYDQDVFELGEQYRKSLYSTLEKAEPSTVILAARWSIYYDTEQFLRPNARPWYTKIDASQESSVAVTRSAIASTLLDTIEELIGMGHNVVLLGQVPEYGLSQVDCVTKQLAEDKDPNSCGPDHMAIVARLAPAQEMLENVAARAGAQLILPQNYLCDDSSCRTLIDGKYIYRDSNHLNISGSRLVIDLLSADLLGALDSR